MARATYVEALAPRNQVFGPGALRNFCAFEARMTARRTGEEGRKLWGVAESGQRDG
jgi:hypothetical protein